MAMIKYPGMFRNEHPVTTDVDISSDSFWNQDFIARDEVFAKLRREAPVSWHRARETPEIPEKYRDVGFWAITKHEDITAISLDHQTFSSDQRRGGQMFRSQDWDIVGASHFLTMDPPDHTRYRKIMSAAFTPKAVARLSQKINERAEQIIDRVIDAGEFDFVTDVSARLPMMTVADLIGVPEELVEAFAQAGDNAVGINDPDIVPDGVSLSEFLSQQMNTLVEIGVDLVEHRKKYPADDIATALAQAEFDGRRLDTEDIGAIMGLLSVAGNDTTKQTTTRTVISLDRNPDQRKWLVEDFDGRIGRSIEEFIRHASPVLEFGRSVTRDVEIRGQQIQTGDKVVIFYCSGNRDEDVWTDAHTFDLNREPRPHLGFGGGGVHYCLGNGVAKAQLRALFSQILTRLPDLQIGEPVDLRSDFIHGVKSLPARTK
ncbi:cytochrome P450 [Rhodococcus qingshengii]|uniref:cytochrome P450 n=1 Tax=Rhodococcus qingshengii TaxID=334542 RepID=UPI0036D9905E